jgi:predicted Fe-Mo cluster-binding NifX family protein
VELCDDDSYAFTEVRRIDPVCDGGEHSAAKFDAVLEILADVDALVVGKIGPGAAEYVAARGLKVLEVSGTVERILTMFIERNVLDGGFRAAMRKT